MLLVVCAVREEAAAVLDGLDAPRERFAVGPFQAESAGVVTTLVTGIGAAAAAAATATALALGPYDAVLSAGIAGGFTLGAGLVVADEIVAADLGVADAGGWCSFGEPVPTGSRELAVELGATTGTVLTVQEVTATDVRRAALLARFPDAAAEAMEGYGVACAATAFGIPCHELRAVSNRVGQRDRGSWDVGGALAVLTAALPVVVDVLEPS